MNTAPNFSVFTPVPFKKPSNYYVYDLPTDDVAADDDDYCDDQSDLEDLYVFEKLERTGELVRAIRSELNQFDPDGNEAREIYFKYELFNGVLMRIENCDKADADGYFWVEKLTIEQRYHLHAKKQAFLEKLLSIRNVEEAAKERRRKILALYPTFRFGKEKEEA